MDRIGPRLAYVPGLDGIRAVSILGIMANHGGLGFAAGGFISVNVFFVLSGFLITTLLVKEWATSGTIRLKRFWARRARRLLPALFALLAGIAVYAWLFAPSGTLASLRLDGLSTLLYVGNWHQILTNQSYFGQTALPSPLLHTWTLAIEEQFYLVWPLVVLGLLKWGRSVRFLFVTSVVAAVASALEMAWLFRPGFDPSRLYYGTDTRAQDLLIGAALAFALSRRPVAATPRGRAALTWTAVAGAAVFATEWIRLNASSAFPYVGGFFMADVAVALVILGVYQNPAGLPARVLGFRPLAFVGKISYGLYLWHWPVFLTLDAARTGLTGWPLFAERFAVSFVIAVASSHFLEIPIRKGAVRSWRPWVLTPVAVGGCAVALLVSTVTPSVAAAAGSTFAPVPPPAHPVPAAARTKVLFVGDSLSVTTFFATLPDAVSYGLAYEYGPHTGCGLATALPLEVRGVVGEPFTGCQDWPTWWTDLLHQYHPQVVAIIVGHWETVDRMYQGRMQHLGDPSFDAYERARIEQAVTVASSTGAKVAFFSSPYYDTGESPDGTPWPEDDPHRVDIFNGLVRAVAAEHPGVVTVVPFGQLLSPQGRFTSTIDGQEVRAPDGIHLQTAGGLYVAPKILPMLRALGTGGPASSGGP